MSPSFRQRLLHNSVFVWLALVTLCVLLIPLLAMSITSEVQWGPGDFVVMGGLLFSAGAGFVLIARRLAYRHWWLAGLLVSGALLLIWAELAVGIWR